MIREYNTCYLYKIVVLPIFYGMEVISINTKKFDKEYSCQWTLEYLYLKKCGIPYTFVKTEDNVTTWKYKKNYQLFDALKNFYKNL